VVAEEQCHASCFEDRGRGCELRDLRITALEDGNAEEINELSLGTLERGHLHCHFDFSPGDLI
jgi:hypothetical protein